MTNKDILDEEELEQEDIEEVSYTQSEEEEEHFEWWLRYGNK